MAGSGGAPSPASEAGGFGYLVPRGRFEVEEVIQKSRFLTVVDRCRDADEAHRFVREAKERFPDATHHCWAFNAGAPGSTRSVGMSDDGEPHGTAGRPMLTALLHSGVGEVVAVCVRWYGGTKLGTGGLVRAYSGGVKLALEQLPVLQKVDRVAAEVSVGYALVSGLQLLLEEFEVRIDHEEYASDVRYRVRVPKANWTELERRLADLSNGEGRLRRV